MKISFLRKTVTATSILIFSGTICRTEDSSPEWKKAEAETARAEWNYTNGMAWPSMKGPVETVMTPGMRTTATTPDGQIIITAGEAYERSYTWDGDTRSVKLWPRKTRWHGALGIYYPGPGEHWKSNNGITRGVLEEAVLWFKNTDDALGWLKKHVGQSAVYTENGLVVFWTKVPERKQINVDVWQLYIAGRKPAALPGGSNDHVRVEHTHEPVTSR